MSEAILDSNRFFCFLFYLLTFISAILSLLIYKIFQVMKQNSLIQSSGILCAIISIVLFVGWPLNNPHRLNSTYCDLQALLLNYCFVSMHAHFSFVMWNNLALAMGWKFLGIKDPSALVGLMFFISISIPVVPTIIVTAYNLPTHDDVPIDNIITKKYFFCVVNKPAWLGYRIWFILFSLPGITAASILFYKTIESRRKMLKFNSTSQFSKLQLARMFFTLIAYLVASILSVAMGFMQVRDENEIYFSDFVPACVGFLLFIAYGFGTTAFEFYKKVYFGLGSYFDADVANDSRSARSSRRNSSISSPTGRRPSSLISEPRTNRRSSQLSESIDETFIYDLPVLKPVPVEPETKDNNKTIKRNQVRRGSEPINRLPNILIVKKNSPIATIPEVNEIEELAEKEIDETKK